MIFVTGGTGLVGSHILLKLSQRGEKFKALKRAASSMDVCKSVFSHYNANDLFAQINWIDGDVNDMYVAALGAFVVRIHKDETVAIGDYLQSNGDGTAKVQADDILRASTIGKVTSTEKTITHADDSYCVPCTLHCG